jgi:DDE superfamily endonuclease
VADRDLGEGTRLAALTGAWVCFEDEAGQALRPQRARTWAPRGHTPVVRVCGNSGPLSAAGMACLKPGRPGRFSCRLRVHRRRMGERSSLSEAGYAHLISAAHHALNAPVIVVWDNLNTHRSRKMHAFTEAREDWLTVVQLPGYAPDLNAVEGAWSVMKRAWAITPPPPSASSRHWSAAASGPSSTGPTSSTHSSDRRGCASTRHRRPWPFNLCM